VTREVVEPLCVFENFIQNIVEVKETMMQIPNRKWRLIISFLHFYLTVHKQLLASSKDQLLAALKKPNPLNQPLNIL
jgi:hypothetical protein